MKNKIKYIQGDLVRDAEKLFDVIGHGCNCFNNMGAGIARDVREKYPGAYKVDVETQYGSKSKLGNYTYWSNDEITVLNLYTQYRYGNKERNADYDAIRSCMRHIKNDFSGKKIGLPLIGAGLAQGDWGLISSIIEEELEGEDVTVVVWERSKQNWQLNLINQ
jgi:O-acetyl-ADP-ribose deacetylase (regulator of RNase III)